MSCEKFSDSIGALIDGTIGPEARRALDEHLQSCAACRALVADFRRIHREAASLPRMTPPDALWGKVRGRIEAQIRTEAAGTPAKAPEEAGPTSGWRDALGAFFRPLILSPARLAAAASVVVLTAAIGTGYVLFRQNAGQPATPPAAQPTQPQIRAAGDNAGDQEFVQSVEMELRLAEEHYEKAIAGLEQIAKADESSLDPQVAAVLQKNLGIIDQAIRDSRVALQTQPTSQVAQATLFEAFRRKVALLQDTITLINEMRKGDQAGAARVLQNLNKG